MVHDSETRCPRCGGVLRYYDSVKRLVRTKHGHKTKRVIQRYKCRRCGSLHRSLPIYILPFKQYEAEIIAGFLEGLITSETLGFEDYPCESTIKNWQNDPKLADLDSPTSV